MDLVHRQPMCPRLCLGEDLERARGDGASALRHLRGVDDRHDVMQVTVLVMMLVGVLVLVVMVAMGVPVRMGVLVLVVMVAMGVPVRMGVLAAVTTIVLVRMLVRAAAPPLTTAMQIRHIMVVGLMAMAQHHVEVAGTHARLGHGRYRYLKLVRNGKTRQSTVQRCRIGSGVQ